MSTWKVSSIYASNGSRGLPQVKVHLYRWRKEVEAVGMASDTLDLVLTQEEASVFTLDGSYRVTVEKEEAS